MKEVIVICLILDVIAIALLLLAQGIKVFQEDILSVFNEKSLLKMIFDIIVILILLPFTIVNSIRLIFKI